jgi:Mg2+-importing ATPase
VGFSVDSGVDIAKAAAGMILLRKDLGILAQGVREGRQTQANILKYIMMAASSNFGNMLSMAMGALVLPFLPMLPVQILLNNLLYDVSEIAIPMDHVDVSALRRPRHWDMRAIRNFMFVLGPISSLFDFATFYLLLHAWHAGEKLFHSGWFVESMATQILVIFIIRSATPWRSRPHPLLLATALPALGVAVALPFTPFGTTLGFVPLPPALMAALAGITLVYLATASMVRRWVLP